MIARVLVAVDGSEGSRKAAQFARDLCAQTQAHLTVLVVVEPPTVAAFGLLDAVAVRASSPSPDELAQADLLVHKLDLPKDKLALKIEVGHAAAVICAQAEALDADLVVVGARGLGRAGAWLIGSVSDRVVHHCTRPVTVIHS